MNLALLSNHDTENGKEALSLLLASPPPKKIPGAYIGSQPDPGQIFYKDVAKTYESLGFSIDLYLDFEEGFSGELFAEAMNRPFIHLSGGNTYRFLNSLMSRGAQSALQIYVENGGAIVGVSAGAMLLTPSIESAILCGDVNEVGIKNLQALDLVPFMFDPHSSKNVGSAKNLKLETELYMASDDDAVLVINGAIKAVGNPIKVPKSGAHTKKCTRIKHSYFRSSLRRVFPVI